jgi:hypothetical protein
MAGTASHWPPPEPGAGSAGKESDVKKKWQQIQGWHRAEEKDAPTEAQSGIAEDNGKQRRREEK